MELLSVMVPQYMILTVGGAPPVGVGPLLICCGLLWNFLGGILKFSLEVPHLALGVGYGVG